MKLVKLSCTPTRYIFMLQCALIFGLDYINIFWYPVTAPLLFKCCATIIILFNKFVFFANYLHAFKHFNFFSINFMAIQFFFFLKIYSIDGFILLNASST